MKPNNCFKILLIMPLLESFGKIKTVFIWVRINFLLKIGVFMMSIISLVKKTVTLQKKSMKNIQKMIMQ